MSILTRCQGVNPHAYTLETITIITTVYQLRCHVLAITLAVFRLYLIMWPPGGRGTEALLAIVATKVGYPQAGGAVGTYWDQMGAPKWRYI